MWRRKKDGIILFLKSLLTIKLIQKDCGSNEASLVDLGEVMVVAERIQRLASHQLVGCYLIDTFSMIERMKCKSWKRIKDDEEEV